MDLVLTEAYRNYKISLHISSVIYIYLPPYTF